MSVSDKRKAQMKLINDKRRSDRRLLLSVFPCLLCGDPDDTVIQWHHVDPKEKLSHVTQGGIKEDSFWDEVLKCIPVCANCHLKIHKNKLCLLLPKL